MSASPTDSAIRAFQRTVSGSLFAACTLATEGNDAERRVARLVVAAAMPVVLVNEDHKHTWRQYLVITDGRVACVEMVPALLGGWKFHRVWVQTSEHAGYSVRVAREGSAAGTTMWTVGRVNHKSLVGAELGSVEMRATLAPDGTLTTEGSEGLGENVKAGYAARVGEEIYQAADITGWLGGILRGLYSAVRFGVGWYVPARHAAAAGTLCATVAQIWGTDWIVPALPVATSDQLRDGIVRGLTTEVADLLHRLGTERATAATTRQTAIDAATTTAEVERAVALAGDIGPKRAQTFLTDLRAIAARVVAYGQVLGEERVATARESVRLAVVDLETLLGGDYQGISARFAAVWDEIELDRKRAGGVL